MPGLYLDVYAPSLAESIAYFVEDSLAVVVLLLIAALLIAVTLVNRFVLKKNAAPSKPPAEPEDKK